MELTPGKRFRTALSQNQPLQIVGTVNAYCAVMATEIGHQAIYLSGGGCANSSYGIPDLGFTTREQVLEDVRRITSVCTTPLLVDVDTGWGDAHEIKKTVEQMQQANVAAIHIEDQVSAKRCGHRPGKKLVSAEEMCERVATCVAARTDPDFFVLARTDAYSVEGIDGAIARSRAYLEAGADGIFAEAMTTLDEYRQFRNEIDAPLLANMTEFGVTPLLDKQEFASVGVDMILYPLSANRAMNRAAESVFQSILNDGSQKSVVDQMQTRDELYRYLEYWEQENHQDRQVEGD